jgi:anti-sigma-K factor RskA
MSRFDAPSGPVGGGGEGPGGRMPDGGQAPGGHHDCGFDAGAYVLGALEPAEAERFRAHLAACAVCRDEVAALQAVVDELPLAAPQVRVPRALRRRVMAEVRASAGARPQRRLRGGAWRSSMPSWGAPALAALAAVLIGVGVGLGLSSGSGSTHVVRASVSARSASVVLRISGSHGELILRGMPQPPAGKIYEVWLQRASGPPQPTSALFGVTSAGDGTVSVPGDLGGVKQVLVTPEPLGGSRAPTHAPVISARLA